jgi:hypothetical protein
MLRWFVVWFEWVYTTSSQVLVCANDLTRCVGGIGRKYCVNRPLVPSTWPMQVGTIQFEVIVLEEAKFVLCEGCKCVPCALFVNESTTPCNWFTNPKAWPKTYNNKPIQWATMLKLSNQQINRWEVGQTLEVVVFIQENCSSITCGKILLHVTKYFVLCVK